MFATHHPFVLFINLLLMFGCFLTTKFLWFSGEEKKWVWCLQHFVPAPLLFFETSTQRTAASCLQTSKLLASLKVLNTSNQKARFCGWVISVFKNCQNCYKCCALLVNPLDKYLKNPLGKNLTSLRQKLRSQIENNFLDSFSFGSPDLLCFFPLNYFFPNKPFFFFLRKPAASFVRINSAESQDRVRSFLYAL